MEWNPEIPAYSRYDVIVLTLDGLEMMLNSLRENRCLEIHLSGDPKEVPSLTTLAIKSFAELVVKTANK